MNWEKAEVVREWLECWTRYLEVVGNFCKQPAGLTPAHLDSYHYYIPFDETLMLENKDITLIFYSVDTMNSYCISMYLWPLLNSNYPMLNISATIAKWLQIRFDG